MGWLVGHHMHVLRCQQQVHVVLGSTQCKLATGHRLHTAPPCVPCLWEWAGSAPTGQRSEWECEQRAS